MKILSVRSVRKPILTFLFLFLLNIAVISSILSIFPLIGKAKAQVTVLGVYPKISAPKNPGEFLVIMVNVTQVTDLYTWAFRLSWRVGLLTCISVQEETGFFDGEFDSRINNAQAEVSVGSTLLGSAQGETGDGRLARLNFEVRGTGNCSLHLFDTEMYNTNPPPGDEIPHSTDDGIFYTTWPKALFTFSPDPRERSEDYGHPIVDETVTFNATTSFDPDQFYKGQTGSGILDYDWDFGDGNYGSGNITTHVYDTAGVYTVTLAVIDDEFETDDETYPLEGLRIQDHALAVTNVTIVNFPPEVSVGSTVYVNATVHNYGSETEYLNVTAYAWTGGSAHAVNTTVFHYREYYAPPGPGWVTRYFLESGDTETVTIRWDTTGFREGDYFIGVKAFIVTPPTHPTPRVALPGLEPDVYDNEMADGKVTITGVVEHNIAVTSVSVDPTDLEVVSPPEWSYVRVTVMNKGNVDEVFNVTVTVYRDSVVFKTEPPDWGKMVTIGPGVTRILELDLLKGTDATEEGDYNVTVTACLVNATTLEEIPDQDITDNMISGIFEIRLIPVVSFTYSPLSPFVGQRVTFNASESYAPGVPGGTIETYWWDFGDGNTTTVTGPIIIHVYKWSAAFVVTLRVTDDVDLENEVTLTGPERVTVSGVHDIAITDVNFSPYRVTTGDSIEVYVTVKNTGFFPETFNVTAYHGQDEIDTQANIMLALGANVTLTFTWSTLGVMGGDYVIKAYATNVTGETRLEDNVRLGGTATVEKLSSSVTLSAFPTSLTVGETMSINGTISPVPADGVEVTIWNMSSGGTWDTLATVTTDANGIYTYSWTPPEAGSYAVKSSWLGDNLTLPSESAPHVVLVQEEPAPAEPEIFLYTTGALAAALVAVIVYFVWIRKPKPA